MDEDRYQQMLRLAVEKDGPQFCLDALQEECAELIQSISHHRRGRCDKTHIIREMADVKLMMDMVQLAIAGHIYFDHFIDQKAREIGFKIKWKGKQSDGKKDFGKTIQIKSCAEMGDHRHDKGAECS